MSDTRDLLSELLSVLSGLTGQTLKLHCEKSIPKGGNFALENERRSDRVAESEKNRRSDETKKQQGFREGYKVIPVRNLCDDVLQHRTQHQRRDQN